LRILRWNLTCFSPVGEIHPDIDLIVLPLNIPKSDLAKKSVKDSALKDDEIGEIIVSGDHVLTKYYNNPLAFDENKIVCNDVVWHKTGDAGFVRGNELFLVGRSKQLIPLSEGYISPFIVENLVQNIKGVRTGTLLKKSDKLILAVESSLPSNQIKDRIKGLLYDRLVVLSKIPRDPRHHTKIDYAALMSMV